MLEKLHGMHLENRSVSEEAESSITQLFEKNKNSLVSAAISAEQRAEHWDKERPVKMHVGCTILALRKNLDISEPTIYTGANSKPKQGDYAYPERKCAEMNGLENALGVDYIGKIDAEKYQEMEKEDLGFIVAIVTTSAAHNTQEQDTADHDVVYPCKQCITNYKYLMEKGLVSEKTIIYNVRTKNGRPEAGEPIPLGELIEKFTVDEEARNLVSISNMLENKDRAISKYFEEVKKINLLIDGQINSLYRHVKDKKTLDSVLKDLQRERVERMLEELGICFSIISHALKSALEEGVEKQRLVDSLGLGHVGVDTESPIFSQSELDAILEELKKPLISDLNLEQD